MFRLYAQLSKATDFFNSVRTEEEELEYHEVLNMIKDRYNEKEVMELIISLYNQSHWKEKPSKRCRIKGLKCVCNYAYPLGQI